MHLKLFRVSRLVLGILAVSINLVGAQNGTNQGANVAEADLLWPREGETFALNGKGMAMIVAIQNSAEAQKYGWRVSWLMCQNRTDMFRECAFTGDFSDSHTALRNDSVVDERSGNDHGNDVYIEISHSYWYSGSGSADFDYHFGGVYTFEWRFSIGPWCEFTNTSTTYSISQLISRGVFNVTLAPSAPYPTPTPTTCGSFLGAVSYAGAAEYVFGHSVANSPGCVQTQPVTIAPTPCRATLGAEQLATAAALMGWDQSNPNATSAISVPTETGKSLSSTTVANGLRVFVALLSAIMLRDYLW
ncbi:hypothetical protein TruAng_009867 [Truncatella angustata]|nr:hypothetical protein TruAng_009867 [Truncatella angustata]